MRILQVSTADILGGAERVAWDLFRICRDRRLATWMAVGARRSADPDVFLIPNGARRSRWTRGWRQVQRLGQARGIRAIARPAAWLAWLGQPERVRALLCGAEDFSFPGTAGLMELAPHRPTVVHAHNLHGGYFDLRTLPALSHQVPVVLTLHDAWLLSGHCAHSLGCERWQIGCGRCPDLALYPAVRRDATADNWQRKRAIYTGSRLHVATPSRWLMDKVERSTLAAGMVEGRVIPNGVDLTVFGPGDQSAARRALGLPHDADVVLFVGYGTRSNPWKDYATMQAAVQQVGAERRSRDLIFLCLGESRADEQIGSASVRFVGFQPGARVALFYQAADLYLHAARADTFPTTVLEAMACGVPVVATSVGGIPEQVDEGVTGFLVPAGADRAMAARVGHLLGENAIRRQMGARAAEIARRRFGLDRMVDDYVEWYRAILERSRPCAAQG
ncbi:MAG: glycosyltransferase [Chloroflexi bacterium]|nr:glycosyltransferase [Chloroflexota bacterium]